MNSKDFGNKVATLRKEKGLTQSELAEKLNISNKAVSRWETGEGYPEITILPSLAKELGVTVDELLKDSESDDSADYIESIKPMKFSEAEDEKPSNKKHREIPVTKPYRKSLTIFNKIGYATIILNLICLLIYAAVIIANNIFNGLPVIFSFLPLLCGISVLITRIGLIITVIGLIAGLLDLYDRQNKASFIITVTLFVITYILPIVMVSISTLVV